MKRYDNIIDLPHHRSPVRRHMSLYDRAAQFSSFAALNGHEEAIAETARLTECKTELSEDMLSDLNTKLRILKEHSREKPEIMIEYFVPDAKKSGGKYVTVNGSFRWIDEYERQIVMCDGVRIGIDELYKIDGGFFEEFIS